MGRADLSQRIAVEIADAADVLSLTYLRPDLDRRIPHSFHRRSQPGELIDLDWFESAHLAVEHAQETQRVPDAIDHRLGLGLSQESGAAGLGDDAGDARCRCRMRRRAPNPAGLRSRGDQVGETEGPRKGDRPRVDFVVAAEVPDLQEHLRRNRLGATERFEVRFCRLDGQIIPVLAATSPLTDDTGQVIGTIGVFTDISERARAEAIQQAVTEAAAHDLKNPLTAIKAHTQLLHRRLTLGSPTDQEQLMRGLTAIDTATGAMDRLIDAMVDAARLRAGHELQLQRQETDLVALVTQAIEAAQQVSDAHTITLETTVPALVGEWDAQRLERVLSNVLGNAIKYSPEGGPIVVRIDRHDTETTPWAVVSVADQGVGVPACDLPHVFERFHRGTNVGRIAGSGIGLAGSKAIVEQHGGTVDIESAEGSGTTVTLRLPIHPGPG